MAYVPGFRYDLFFSYACEDNVDGWVERFQAQLTGEVARLLGRPFTEKTVFLDKLRLQVGQAYPAELDNSARDSALLVALLSPSYLTSDWCSREREVFQQHLAPKSSFAESLAVVRVRPTGREEVPKTLRDSQREDLVIPDFQEPWPAGSGKWIQAVNRLAVEVRDCLQRLRSRAGTVFVGRTLFSDMDLRGRIVDYLSEQHFRANAEALLDDRTACQKALAESACAVHFLGGASEHSLALLEDSVALCLGRTVVFQPFGVELKPTEELFLSELDPQRYPQRVGPNETDLKKFLEELLTRTREAEGPRAADLGLVCEPADFPWAETFQSQGCSVDYPRFLLEKLMSAERIRLWSEFMRNRRGLLFYQGRSKENKLAPVWRMAEQEHANAMRRWYLDAPDLDEKRERRPSDPVYPEGLEEFLRKIRSAKGAAEGS